WNSFNRPAGDLVVAIFRERAEFGSSVWQAVLRSKPLCLAVRAGRKPSLQNPPFNMRIPLLFHQAIRLVAQRTIFMRDARCNVKTAALRDGKILVPDLAACH